MKSVKFLERLKKERELTSDRQLAIYLGVGTSTISQYMKGNRVMDRETCAKVAMALNLNEHEAMQLIAATAADQAEQAGEKSLWEVFMNRGAAVAASVLMATSVNLFLTPQNAEARTYSPTSTPQAERIYIMSNRRWRNTLRLRTMAAWMKRLFMPAALVPTAS
jgi:transcriptional regulator with XRE-family HTH domain